MNGLLHNGLTMANKKYINTMDVVELTRLLYNEVLSLVSTGVLPNHKSSRDRWGIARRFLDPHVFSCLRWYLSGNQFTLLTSSQATTLLLTILLAYSNIIDR